MIDIGSWWNLLLVVGCSILAMGAFSAASQHWLLVRNRWWETVALLLICFTLFRPGFWLDQISEPYTDHPASEVMAEAERTPEGSPLRLRVKSLDMAGDEVVKLVRLTMGKGATVEQRLSGTGMMLTPGEGPPIVASVRLGSEARKYGIQPGDEIVAVVLPADRPSRYWFAIPAIALFGFILWLQRRRREAMKLQPA
jgi:hypothetical protein